MWLQISSFVTWKENVFIFDDFLLYNTLNEIHKQNNQSLWKSYFIYNTKHFHEHKTLVFKYYHKKPIYPERLLQRYTLPSLNVSPIPVPPPTLKLYKQRNYFYRTLN